MESKRHEGTRIGLNWRNRISESDIPIKRNLLIIRRNLMWNIAQSGIIGEILSFGVFRDKNI